MTIPRHVQCYVCNRKGCPGVPASVRIFSGYGGGFAACIHHVSDAATAAIKPLLGTTPLADGYTVTAWEVDWKGCENYPKQGRPVDGPKENSVIAINWVRVVLGTAVAMLGVLGHDPFIVAIGAVHVAWSLHRLGQLARSTP